MEVSFYRVKSITVKRLEPTDTRSGWTELTVQEEDDGVKHTIVFFSNKRMDPAPVIGEAEVST